MFASLLLVLVALFLIFVNLFGAPWSKRSRLIQKIPGPIRFPLLGTRYVYLNYKISQIHEYFKDLNLHYGAIVKEETVFNFPLIHVFEKGDIEKVFKSTGRRPLRPPTDAIAQYRRSRPDRYANAGITNEQGETWQYLRGLVTAALTSPQTIMDFLPEMNTIADDWCQLLAQKRDCNGLVQNLEELAGRLGLETTCALVLGRRMGFLLNDNQDTNAKDLAEAVHMNFIASRDTQFGLPFYKFVETEPYKRLCESERTIYDLATELIKNAGIYAVVFNRPFKNFLNLAKNPINSILVKTISETQFVESILCKMFLTGRWTGVPEVLVLNTSSDDSVKESAIFQSVIKADIDEREKKTAIVDFIAAGIHTLKNSFLFFLYQVAINPDVQKKILEDDENRAYLKACYNETLRLTPTVTSLARIIEKDMRLSDYLVPANTIIILHTGIACTSETNFKEAGKFWPERWLNEERHHTVSNSTYIMAPFGNGRRICPGKRFIDQVLPIILEKTINAFEVSSKEKLKVIFEFLMSPKGPVNMIFNDRI